MKDRLSKYYLQQARWQLNQRRLFYWKTSPVSIKPNSINRNTEWALNVFNTYCIPKNRSACKQTKSKINNCCQLLLLLFWALSVFSSYVEMSWCDISNTWKSSPFTRETRDLTLHTLTISDLNCWPEWSQRTSPVPCIVYCNPYYKRLYYFHMMEQSW